VITRGLAGCGDISLYYEDEAKAYPPHQIKARAVRGKSKQKEAKEGGR